MWFLYGGVGIKSNFYTLNGYRLKNSNSITEAMEDYLEMIYRKKEVGVKELAEYLNVKPASVSKMANKLKNLNLIIFERYSRISLTKEGKIIGKYLLERHIILKKFFKLLNKKEYKLEQVEKIEHFIDDITINNIETLINKNIYF